MAEKHRSLLLKQILDSNGYIDNELADQVCRQCKVDTPKLPANGTTILKHICGSQGLFDRKHKSSKKSLDTQLCNRIKKHFSIMERKIPPAPPAPTIKEIDDIIATITETNIPEDWINDNSQKTRKMIMVLLESDLEWREDMYMLIVDDFENDCYVEKWGKETSIIRCILGHAEMKVSRY